MSRRTERRLDWLRYHLGSRHSVLDGRHYYTRRSPLLWLWRLNHWATGPLRGCSCTRCFHHRWRLVPAREIYDDRVRTAKEITRLQKQVADLRDELRIHRHSFHANGREYVTETVHGSRRRQSTSLT